MPERTAATSSGEKVERPHNTRAKDSYNPYRLNSRRSPVQTFLTDSSDTEEPTDDLFDGVELDLVKLHIAEGRRHKYNRENNQIYGHQIFQGQIRLLELELLHESGYLDQVQRGSVQNILEDPKAAFLLDQVKRVRVRRVQNPVFRPAHERVLEIIRSNLEGFQTEITGVSEGDDPQKQAEFQGIIESRLAVFLESASAFDNLVSTNMALTIGIARRFIGRGVEFSDLIQVGYEGMMKAAAQFNTESGLQFSTYATWWIKQAMTRAIADLGATIRAPVHTVEKIKKIDRIRGALTQMLGREPTEKEVSEAAGPDYDVVQSAMKTRQVTSLNKLIGETGDIELGDMLPDGQPDHVEGVSHQEAKGKIDEVLAILAPREREVLEMRFGFVDGNRSMTLDEVGKVFGVTRERIRQIEAKALRKLSHPSVARKLKPFLREFA